MNLHMIDWYIDRAIELMFAMSPIQMCLYVQYMYVCMHLNFYI